KSRIARDIGVASRTIWANERTQSNVIEAMVHEDSLDRLGRVAILKDGATRLLLKRPGNVGPEDKTRAERKLAGHTACGVTTCSRSACTITTRSTATCGVTTRSRASV